MPDSELDQLERDLTQAAEIWFSAPLHMKLARLIEIARSGEQFKKEQAAAFGDVRANWAKQVVNEQPVMQDAD